MTTSWIPPGAGQWKRDDAHITTVMTGYFQAIAWPAQLEGFEAGFAHYGATLAGFDTAVVAGRVYMRPRIAGAPAQAIWGDKPPAKLPGPGKAPPRLIMKLLFKLHPELRRRARRAAEVWDKRIWRDVVRRWFDELRPSFVAECRALTRIDLAALSDAEMADHLETAAAQFRKMFVQHFTHSPMPAVVVGDFIVRASGWSGATASDVLTTLQGASPASRAGAEETARIARALAAAPALRAAVESARPPAEIVAALRADTGEVGRLVNDYLEVHGLRPITGLDIYHQQFAELPELLVRALRATLAGDASPPDRAAEAFAALRARVPAAHHAELDDAYAEARLAYSVRDDDVGVVLWCTGLVHRAVREAGRRLALRGDVRDATHAYDATPEELPALLRGGARSSSAAAGTELPSADELERRSKRRAELDALEPPFVLGEAGPMPAPEIFPPAVARMQRAVMAFLSSMEGESRSGDGATSTSGAAQRAGVTLAGTPVSPGVYEGRARLVTTPADFTKIERGDVLVARFTSPAYNVILPLLGAIITERGGLLSHAAIVAREYGIPALVTVPHALAEIPDGAIVRVDGKTGTVTIVRAADSVASQGGASVAAPTATGASVVASTSTAGADAVHTPTTAGRIVPLAAATDTEFGGKARALAAAVAAKLPVPDGFALDADLVARVVAGEAAARAQVTAALAALPGPWAVRSSAVGEDSAQASFAGQHATVLGVERGALLDAIASVHASGQTEAAKAYRAKMGVRGAPRMGVVVQTLLRPDISGVLFSRDPSQVREGRVIEATWGLGEALVSGLVTPDRYRVAADGKILERAIGDKDVAIEARDGGGTAEVAIRDERARAACLDDARIVELSQLASRCEQLFGGPQDLEWAVANGRLHLLQSRPVTTQSRAR